MRVRQRHGIVTIMLRTLTARMVMMGMLMVVMSMTLDGSVVGVMMIDANPPQPDVMLIRTGPDQQSQDSEDAKKGAVRSHEHRANFRAQPLKVKAEGLRRRCRVDSFACNR